MADLISMENVNDETPTLIKYRILLHESENHETWFENWSRIEKLATNYFERKKSWVFGIILLLVISLSILVYNIFILNDWFNTNVILIGCGLLYFMTAFSRLLLVAMRFSTLQHKYIALLQNQYSFTIRKLMDTESKKHQLICLYLQSIITQIKFRSINPKIAGVVLDDALVKLFVSTVFGLFASVCAYVLKQR
eukprot:301918_1